MPTTPAEANMPTATRLRADTSMIQKTNPTAMKKNHHGGQPFDHAEARLGTGVDLGQIAAAARNR